MTVRSVFHLTTGAFGNEFPCSVFVDGVNFPLDCSLPLGILYSRSVRGASCAELSWRGVSCWELSGVVVVAELW
ncbi:hypothetical protein R1flu_013319 [Riccia fluitans]|uniref:Uncharacterized protein n=1 Tax=Riccia fluitans TaxID=41844 RepID=A0ABD1YD17_9MARC